MAMDADIAPGLPDEPAPDAPYVKFESRISIRDVADLVFTRATHSTGAQGIAGFLMTLGLLGGIGGVHPDLWVPPLILSLAIGTGFILLPFIWWSYLSTPELLKSTVEADASGVIISIGERQLRHPWTVYRAARRQNRLFILTSRVVQPRCSPSGTCRRPSRRHSGQFSPRSTCSGRWTRARATGRGWRS